MEKAFVAQRVATKLFSTEAAVDQAMVEATELLADLLKARSEVNASLVFADEVQVKMEAIKALGEARSSMVGVHNELAEAQLRLGIRTKLGYMDKPAMRKRETVTAMREVG